MYFIILLCTYQCYPGGRGGGADRGGDFDNAFMPEGVAFDFMDLPQGVDIWFFPFPGLGSLTYITRVKWKHVILDTI